MGRKPKKQALNGGLNGGSSGAVIDVKPLSSESEEDSQIYEVTKRARLDINAKLRSTQ